jgi:putative spermidine/putrescine transport system ATP-binding protein
MSAFGERFPRELSGGQQQRVALARTLAVRPRILLLDEPFAALDKSLRLDMQIEIRRLQRELNITTIMVTHDQEEAMSMADRVAVLNNGRLEQFAPAAEIYDYPASPFVASFVGTANMLPARMILQDRGADSAEHIALVGSGKAPLLLEMPAYDGGIWPAGLTIYGKAGAADSAHTATAVVDTNVVLAIRPEQWDWTPTASTHHDISDPADNGLPVVVQLVLPLGPSLIVEALLDNTIAIKLMLARGPSALPQTGQLITLRIKAHTTVRVFKA